MVKSLRGIQNQRGEIYIYKLTTINWAFGARYHNQELRAKDLHFE